MQWRQYDCFSNFGQAIHGTHSIYIYCWWDSFYLLTDWLSDRYRSFYMLSRQRRRVWILVDYALFEKGLLYAAHSNEWRSGEMCLLRASKWGVSLHAISNSEALYMNGMSIRALQMTFFYRVMCEKRFFKNLMVFDTRNLWAVWEKTKQDESSPSCLVA